MSGKYIPITILFLILFASVTLSPTFAAYLHNRPVQVTQPDGAVLDLFASGDEFYNWLHDKDGYVIEQNPDTGYYVYAAIVDGKIVPSNYVVGWFDPAYTGIEKNLRPSADVLAKAQRKRTARAAQTATISTKGNIRNLVIFVRFSNSPAFGDQVSIYDELFNNATESSLYNYYVTVSRNQLFIRSSFLPDSGSSLVASYVDSHPREYYLPYSAANTIGFNGEDEEYQREYVLVQNIITSNVVQDSLDALKINGVPVTAADLDTNNDGFIDSVSIIIQGQVGAGHNQIIWPHQNTLPVADYPAKLLGKQVNRYNFLMQNDVKSEDSGSGVGVICHEMFHLLGAPDLYRKNYQDDSPVGNWDIMDSSGNPPVFATSFMRFHYGKWIDLPVIEEPGVYTLNPVSAEGVSACKIPSPNSKSQFFVVEYRKKEGTFESGLSGSGLLVYRVDTSSQVFFDEGNYQGPPDLLYVYRPGGTAPRSVGDIANAFFSAEAGRTKINDTTNPPCFLQNNAKKGGPGCINISKISAAGSTISFRLDFTCGTPVMTPPPGDYINFAEMDVALSCPTEGARIYYTTDGSTPTTRSTLYTRPFKAFAAMTIKAIAVKENYFNSTVASGLYLVGVGGQGGGDFDTVTDISNANAGSGGCFIATAAYGSYLDPHVMALRRFRDNYLLTNKPGTIFVDYYYRNSPPLAAVIARNETLRLCTRLALTPLVLGIEYPAVAIIMLFLCCWGIRFRYTQIRQGRLLARTSE